MRIYPRGAQRIYWVDFEVNGRRVRRSTGTSNKALADEFAAKLKHDTWRAVRLNEPPPHTWDEAVLGWLTVNASMSSLEDSKLILTWLTERLRGRRLSAITEDLLADVLEQRAKYPKNRAAIARAKARGTPVPEPSFPAPSTVNKCMVHVSMILQYAKSRKWLRELPDIPLMRETERRKPIQWITQERFADLLRELPEHLRPIAVFAVATGLRESNVRLLRWDQVDLENRRCWFDTDETKADNNLGVPLSDAALHCLTLQQGKHARWVFPVPHRRAGTTAWDAPTSKVSNTAWYNALRRAGLTGLRFHDLRHSWASWHANSGTPEKVLQALGGWATAEMVQRYSHLAAGFAATWANNGQAGFGTKVAQPPDPAPPAGAAQPENAGKSESYVGWAMGFEPTTTGITRPESDKNHCKIIDLAVAKRRKTG